MANAIPMIQRCAWRQWRGLTPQQREWCTVQWLGPKLDADGEPVHPFPNACTQPFTMPQKVYPIWVADSGIHHTVLLSIKEEFTE